MDLQQIRRSAISPALALLPAKMSGDRAEVMLLAIGLQESRFEHRRQIGGPAVGFWQFERGGGVRGALTHPSSREHAAAICKTRGITASASAVYSALETDDVLAAAFARLLLWTDPASLPAVGAQASAWDLYLRTWRPGKPHPGSWKGLYMQAMAAVVGEVSV
jgi:hypothetical protein